MQGARSVWVTMLFVLLVFAQAAVAEPRIQYAEAVDISSASGRLEFQAYGRRFSLAVEQNDRALASLGNARKAELGAPLLLRGRVEGIAGSWVRLTRVRGGYEGAIWDGQDLYSITTRANIAASLTTPPEGEGETVVYRLSDTLDAFAGKSCALDAAPAVAKSGLEQYKQLLGEIGVRAQALAVDKQVNVALIVDQSYYSYYGSDWSDYVLAAFNVADGIFMQQLDLALIASELRYANESPNPFTLTQASALLGQLQTYRQQIPAVRATGVAHLVTGSTLDGVTAGIATLESACTAEGASVSEGRLGGTTTTALIMAHEFGHNFGAGHDSTTECAGYLMAAQINSSSTFSQCSLEAIRSYMTRVQQGANNCITSPQHGDAEVRIGAVQAYLAEPFVVPVEVRSMGSTAVNSVRLHIDIPSFLTDVRGATTTGGGCSVNDHHVICEYASIAPGETRIASVELVHDYVGGLEVTAFARSPNDPLTGNNNASASVSVVAGADARLGASAGAASIYLGEDAEVTLVVESLGVRPVRTTRLSVATDFVPTSVVPSQGTCAMWPGSPFSWNCELGDVATGSTATVVVRGRPTQSGVRRVAASVTGSNDVNSMNNNVAQDVRVLPTRDVAFEVGPTNPLAPIGVPLTITRTLTSLAPNPVDDVIIHLTGVNVSLYTATVTGAACVVVSDYSMSCPVGTMAPGDVRVVTVVVEAAAPMYFPLSMGLYTANDEDFTNNSANVNVSFRFADEVVLSHFAGIQRVVEGVSIRESGDVRAAGVNAAQNLRLTFDIPAPAHVLAASLDGGTCQITQGRQVLCTRASLPTNQVAYFAIDVRANEPGSFHGEFAVTADADTLTNNNTSSRDLNVVPFTDVGLRKTGSPSYLLAGQSYDMEAEYSVGRRPVANARLNFTIDRGATVESVTAGAASCTFTDLQGSCALGDLAADTTVPVRVRVRTSQTHVIGELSMHAVIAEDFAWTNDRASFSFHTHDAPDLEVTVGAASVSGTVGAAIALPRITVSSPGGLSEDVVVRVPLPAFVSVTSVSSSMGICTGTTLIECFIGSMLRDTSVTIDVSVNPTAVGNANAEVRVTSTNGVNSANDARSVSIAAVAAAPPPAPPPSNPPVGGGGGSAGGKKGGGSMEWMLLGLLGALVWRRAGRSRPAFG
jgi:hypothetical protein